MSSSSKPKPVEAPEEEVTPVEAPSPVPVDINSDIAKQMVTDKQKKTKGRSWSLLTRSGGDSRRTMLSNTQPLG